MIAIPYIAQERRKPIDAALNALDLSDDGELNYAITRLCLRYLACTVAGAARYVDFNAVMGVLTCVQLEFYRMQVVPYEQSKIVQHGNVRP